MRTLSVFLVFACFAVGCGSSQAVTDPGTGATGGERGPDGAAGQGGFGGQPETFIKSLSHVFPPVFVDVNGEVADVCQSWTLDNDEPIYVNAVRQTNEGGWHHSNWTFGPENVFDGPDGTWDCAERDYSLQFAVGAGGVLFAQSTQAFEETQSFSEGAVLVIPPRSRIVGNIHLLNVSGRPIENSLAMELGLIEEQDVKVRLSPVGLFNQRIAIDPLSESRFSIDCDLQDIYQRVLGVDEMPTYNIYYVLGHYHAWGNYLKLSFVDLDGSERTIVEYDSTPGDVLGVKVDPPMNSNGATGMRLTCGYYNDSDRVKYWGIGDQEMCAFFGYVDGGVTFQGQPGPGDGLVPLGEDEEGRHLYDLSGCNGLIGIPGGR